MLINLPEHLRELNDYVTHDKDECRLGQVDGMFDAQHTESWVLCRRIAYNSWADGVAVQPRAEEIKTVTTEIKNLGMDHGLVDSTCVFLNGKKTLGSDELLNKFRV